MTTERGAGFPGGKFTLSPRDIGVIQHRANGREAKEIASLTGIATSTVEERSKNILSTNRSRVDSSHQSVRALMGCIIINGVLDGVLTVENVPDEIHLTNRQTEIAGFLLNGYSNSDIATEGATGLDKVNKHVSDIYKRTDSNNYLHFVAIMTAYLMRGGEIQTGAPRPPDRLIKDLPKNSILARSPRMIRNIALRISQELGVSQDDLTSALVLYSRDHDEETIRALATYLSTRESEISQRQ